MDKDEQKSQTLSGAAVQKLSVTDSSLTVGTAESNCQSAIVDESSSSCNVTVQSTKASAEKMGEGATLKVVDVRGDPTLEKQRVKVTKATFARNKMEVKNTGSGNRQIGIETAAQGDMQVEVTDNRQTMENENAHRCLQAAVMRDGGAGATGSTAVESSGNVMVMKNSGKTSGCIQAGVIGSGSPKSSEGGKQRRSKRPGNNMTMHNGEKSSGNIQVGSVGKTVKK